VRRIGWLVAVLTLASLFTPAPARAERDPTVPLGPPTACTISRLDEAVDWSQSIVTGVDPTGRYIAGRGYPDDPWSDLTRYPVIWDRGVRTPVPLPGVDQVWNDVNSAGVAVGASYDADSWEALTPWVYVDGQVRPLPGIASGAAVAVNERGAIAGNRSDRVPVWWPSAGSDPEKLSLPGNAVGAFADDIDDDGTIVGRYWGADGYDNAVVWLPDGTFMVLPPPPGYGSGSSALSIRNGWVAGWAEGPTSMIAVRWHLPSGGVDTFPQFQNTANHANTAGWMVGRDWSGAALFASDTGDLTLPGLTGQPDDNAWRMSDDGRVIGGQATDKEGRLRAVRWDCT
jgi:uncharacterized membrane protein